MPQENTFETHIGFLVHEVSRKRRNYFDRVLKPMGITRAQLVMLLQLERLPPDTGISQRQLAEEMNVRQVSLGEKVALLEASGCIERRIDAADRRQRNLFLTDLGRIVIQKSRKLVSNVNAEVLDGIPAEDIQAAERTLEAMRQNLARLDG